MGKRAGRQESRADAVPVPPLATGNLRVPDGVPPSLWRRLRIFGSWAAVAGKPLDAVSRPVDFDERKGIVRIAVASERWSVEMAPYRDLLLNRLEAASGQRIGRLELTVEPRSFGAVRESCDVAPVEGADGGGVGGARPPSTAAPMTSENPAAADKGEVVADLPARLERLRDRYLAAAAARRR